MKTPFGLGLALSIVVANAAEIPVENWSFEDPKTFSAEVVAIPGWVQQGHFSGVWNIDVSPLGFWNPGVGAPDGEQGVYVTSADLLHSPGSITQTLPTLLDGISSYRLSAWVGHPLGFGSTLGTVFSMQLLANGNLLAEVSGTSVEGDFQEFEVAFNSVGSAFVGQPLGIRLASNGAQTIFDGIRLRTVPDLSSFPFTAISLAGVLLLSLRRRRENQ